MTDCGKRLTLLKKIQAFGRFLSLLKVEKESVLSDEDKIGFGTIVSIQELFV